MFFEATEVQAAGCLAGQEWDKKGGKGHMLGKRRHVRHLEFLGSFCHENCCIDKVLNCLFPVEVYIHCYCSVI